MTKLQILSFLRELISGNEILFAKTEPFPHNHLTCVHTPWGAYRELSFGIDYYIQPHILAESFPACLELDWTQPNSRIKGIIENRFFFIEKNEGENTWVGGWKGNDGDRNTFNNETFDGLVHQIDAWLKGFTDGQLYENECTFIIK